MNRRDESSIIHHLRKVEELLISSKEHKRFGLLFDSLLRINGLSVSAFAKQYRESTRCSLSANQINLVRRSQVKPSYKFILNIVDRTLLSLDTELVGTNGPYRSLLFELAGYTEVTDESVASWNAECINQLTRLEAEEDPLSWRLLIRKLIDFQIQGGRLRYRDVASLATSDNHKDFELSYRRFYDLLSAQHTCPTFHERVAICKALKLSPDQIQVIEDQISLGGITLAGAHRSTTFADTLCDILRILKAHGISQKQLCSLSPSGCEGVPIISPESITAWKSGRHLPRVQALHGLELVLISCKDRNGRAIIPKSLLDSLIRSTQHDTYFLNQSPSELISTFFPHGCIKSLLKQLRQTTHLRVNIAAIDSPVARLQGKKLSKELASWESICNPRTPTIDQLIELLRRYDRIIRINGHPGITDKDLEKTILILSNSRTLRSS